ncbi:glycosyltransferase family 4 protein [Blastococcus sp. SYSU DS0973]
MLTVPGVVSSGALVDSRPADVAVAFSEKTATWLTSAGYPDVRVVPPGVDLERWRREPRQTNDRPVLFFAGHTSQNGGIREAIEVAARVEASGRSVHLLAAMRTRRGQQTGEELAAVASMARAAGLTSVEVHGRVHSMPALVRRADVVLFVPPVLEGGKADLPLVVLEALAAGRPAVTTQLPQMRALSSITDQVPVGQLDRAAEAVCALLQDPGLWERRADLGRQTVERDYSWARMCRTYLELYEELTPSV